MPVNRTSSVVLVCGREARTDAALSFQPSEFVFTVTHATSVLKATLCLFLPFEETEAQAVVCCSGSHGWLEAERHSLLMCQTVSLLLLSNLFPPEENHCPGAMALSPEK